MIPSPRFTVVITLWLALVTPPIAHAKVVHDDRIRTLDPQLQQLFYEGMARSETFRALVSRIQEGDVVVYVRYETLPPGVHGQLAFLSVAAGLRYVIVGISPELNAPRSIGILAHELQHAVEIVDQPQIVDVVTFGVAYEQATYRRKQFADGGIGYDTLAAVQAGVQVWKELAVAPDMPVGTK